MIRTMVFAVIGCSLHVAFAKESTPPGSAERDVLAVYVGDWDIAFDADDPFSKGTLTGQWVLGGAYLEQTGDLTARFVPHDMTIKMLTTYDVDSGQYKRWIFLSNGRNSMSTGTWNPKTSTMTWVSEQFEPLSKQTVQTKTTENFRDDGTVDVSKVSISAGREVGRSVERRTRRK